jgi:adenylate cyclase
MNAVQRPILTIFTLLAVVFATAQTSKEQQLEEMRKLKQQMMEEQKTINQQQEWNSQNAQTEIKKLNTENQMSRQEIQKAKQDVTKARQELIAKQNELLNKQRELSSTQSMIDSAKAQLLITQTALQTQEMIVKRTLEEKQRQEDSIKILNKEQELQAVKTKAQEIELNAQRAKTNLYLIIAAIALSMLSVIGVLFFARAKTLRELEEKNKIIEEEKKRSDELLLNILPSEVMQELKVHGKTTARNYRKATVLFADIKDFTIISEQLSPDELIEALDAYFERFDRVIQKYDIEKIKTIGDAYVCAGGIPVKSEDNPHIVVQAAIGFVEEIENLKRERTAAGKRYFEFRIGIHTGHLVAGVIGIRKFAYDIWGDTVNMAARMQQSSEPNKINISGATYELVKDKFACVYRGKLEAKNKGEIDMYFVEKAIN